MSGDVTSFTQISQGMAQQKKIVAAMRKQPCFRGTNVVHLSMMCTVANTRYHTRYSIVYREGAKADTFYVLKKGSIEFTSADRKDVEVVKVADGDELFCFGTEGVAAGGGGMPRMRTAMCAENTELLHFDTFRKRLSGTGAESLAQRAFAAYVEGELKRMPLFFGLKASMLFEIACMFELKEVASSGKVIFTTGMPADALYILASGRVVLESVDGLEVADLDAGRVEDGFPFFGERAVLEPREPRQTSAVTKAPCRMLVLPKSFFPRLLDIMPSLTKRLLEFNTLRMSGAELARKNAKDKVDRVRVASMSEHYNTDVRIVMKTRREQEAACRSRPASNSSATGKTPDAAATTVQKHFRGSQVRHAENGRATIRSSA